MISCLAADALQLGLPVGVGGGSAATAAATAAAAASARSTCPRAQAWGDSPGQLDDAQQAWGDDDFSDDQPVPAPAGEGAWGDGTSWGSDGSASWGGAGDDAGPTADWLSPAPVESAKPATPRRPIETTKVGIVGGPYKRRRGYHAEVAVQHDGGAETIHRLWFGHEVLSDVAELKGRERRCIDVDRFSEAVLGFLKKQGVDLADPEWGMHDDSIPFTTEHLPMRTLFEYYPLMAQNLADELLTDETLAEFDAAEAEMFENPPF